MIFVRKHILIVTLPLIWMFNFTRHEWIAILLEEAQAGAGRKDKLRARELSVTALAEALEISQANLSQHLSLLRARRAG